jgi:MarR family transcriptional regulator, organic hydroperoxide resistance regulator
MVDKAEEIPEVIDNLRQMFRTMNDYSKNAERATGLTGPQLWAMKLLSESSPMRVTDLARRMYLHPATVVGILDRLETKDMVMRTRSKEDRRAVDLALTERGKGVVAEAPEVAQSILVKGLEGLSDEEFARVAEVMKLLARIIGTEHSIPKQVHSS